jgi:hypothetical protein
LYSSIHFSEALGAVHPESCSTLTGLYFFPSTKINILISGLLPDLGSGEQCFHYLGVIESLEAQDFCFHAVLMMNWLSTQLWPQLVVDTGMVRVILYS